MTEVSPQTGPRNRNVGIETVRVADLLEAEENHRGHPASQRAAFGEVEEEIGWHGYPEVWRRPDGRLQLFDGALRKSHLLQKYGPECVIQVNVTDLDEDEARTALLTTDHLAAMADSHREKLQALRDRVKAQAPRLKVLLEDVAKRHRLDVARSQGRDESEVGTAPTEVTVTFTGDQWTVVSQAIAAVRSGEQDGTIPSGRALELICADFLSGS